MTVPPFNGATAFRRWKHGEPPPSGSLQWGFRRWKLRLLHSGDGLAVLPDTSWPQWGHRLSAMETGVGVLVLDSAASSLRNIFSYPGLQWGHRLSAMETVQAIRVLHRPSMGPFRRPVIQYPTSPSMGPPPFGDGNYRISFNGATAFRRWKQRPPDSTPSMFSAMRNTIRQLSSGPPFGDGNLTVPVLFVLYGILQWGHRLSAMETTTVGYSGRPSSGTFNGATAFRRWKPVLQPGPALRGVIRYLQWGHRLSAMETQKDAS